jgi:hypothetical protein
MQITVEKILLKYGAQEEKENRYKLKTKYGTLVVVDFKDDTFIPMYFEKDFNLSSFLADTHDHTIGKHSFKWNLHSTDKQFNLERLEQRLNFITKCTSN